MTKPRVFMASAGYRTSERITGDLFRWNAETETYDGIAHFDDIFWAAEAARLLEINWRDHD